MRKILTPILISWAISQIMQSKRNPFAAAPWMAHARQAAPQAMGGIDLARLKHALRAAQDAWRDYRPL